MRHLIKKKILKRKPNQRRALFRQLGNALFWQEKLVTTEAKAKALRPKAEKLITIAKTKNLSSRRHLLAVLNDEKVVEKLMTNLAKRYAVRAGGYTKIIKLAKRQGDGAPLAKIELV